MRVCPKSRWENEDGLVNLALVGVVPEFPEVIAWEKEFADECDRLAELEAIITDKQRWGRWYLDRTSLNTQAIRPKVGGEGVHRGYIYDIALDRLSENWVRHMEEKNWVGEKGLADLAEAITFLRGTPRA